MASNMGAAIVDLETGRNAGSLPTFLLDDNQEDAQFMRDERSGGQQAWTPEKVQDRAVSLQQLDFRKMVLTWFNSQHDLYGHIRAEQCSSPQQSSYAGGQDDDPFSKALRRYPADQDSAMPWGAKNGSTSSLPQSREVNVASNRLVNPQQQQQRAATLDLGYMPSSLMHQQQHQHQVQSSNSPSSDPHPHTGGGGNYHNGNGNNNHHLASNDGASASASNLPYDWPSDIQLSAALQALREQSTSYSKPAHAAVASTTSTTHNAASPRQSARTMSAALPSSPLVGGNASFSPQLGRNALLQQDNLSAGPQGTAGTSGSSNDLHEAIGNPYSALLSAHARKQAAAALASRYHQHQPQMLSQQDLQQQQHAAPFAQQDASAGGPPTPSAAGSSTQTSFSESHAGTPLDLLRSVSSSGGGRQSPAYFQYQLPQSQPLGGSNNNATSIGKKGTVTPTPYFAQQYESSVIYDSPLQQLSSLALSSSSANDAAAERDALAALGARHLDSAQSGSTLTGGRPSKLTATVSGHQPEYRTSAGLSLPPPQHMSISAASSPATRTSFLQDPLGQQRRPRSRSLIGQSHMFAPPSSSVTSSPQLGNEAQAWNSLNAIVNARRSDSPNAASSPSLQGMAMPHEFIPRTIGSSSIFASPATSQLRLQDDAWTKYR